jgi:hypothetical protein
MFFAFVFSSSWRGHAGATDSSNGIGAERRAGLHVPGVTAGERTRDLSRRQMVLITYLPLYLKMPWASPLIGQPGVGANKAGDDRPGRLGVVSDRLFGGQSRVAADRLVVRVARDRVELLEPRIFLLSAAADFISRRRLRSAHRASPTAWSARSPVKRGPARGWE